MLAVILWCVAIQQPSPVALTQETLPHIRELILPKAAEEEFQQIPWRTSLWSAVVEANQKDKPILLWAMNGHPLGCT
jgi:hypothetical protein